MQSHPTDPIKKRCLLSVALAWGVALLSFLAIWHVNAWTIYETAINSNFGVPANVPVTFQRFNPVTGTPLVTTQTKLVAGVLSVPTIATGLYHVDIGAIRVNIIVPAGTGTNTLTELATYALNFSILTTTNIYKAKISSTDTNAAFLNQSLLAGTGITITTNNPGADETLTISAGAGAVGDGNKGDIIVSGSGTNWIRTDSIMRYGAVGNGTTEDQAAFQTAANSADGTVIYVPPGAYLWNGTGTELLLMTNRVSFVGASDGSSIIVVKSTVASTIDWVRIAGATGTDRNHWEPFKNIRFVAQSGTPGRDKLVLDCTSQGMSYMTFPRVSFLGLSTGYALRLINPSLTDGFFLVTFDQCRFSGNAFLQRAGDNVRFKDCNFYGPGWGLEATFVAGASSFIMDGNNLTANAGQIKIGGASAVTLIGNNCEWPQSGTTAIAGDPLVKIDGAGDQVITLTMIGNTLYAAGVADTDGIEIGYVKPGSAFIGNRITVAGTGTKIQEAYAHYFDDETGNIGFGTTIPATFGNYVFQTDTNGPAILSLRNISSNALSSSLLRLNGYGGSWDFDVGSVAKNTNALVLKFGSSEHLFVSQWGNVGLGLNPENYSYYGMPLLVSRDTNGPVSMFVRNIDPGENARSGIWLATYGNSYGMWTGSDSNNNHKLHFGTDFTVPAPKMTLTTNGFLGLGTTNPLALLHLEATSPSIRLTAAAGNLDMIYGSDGIVRLALDSAANTNVLTIADSGNVGVGVTPDANARLQTSSFSAPQIDQAPLIVTIANGETLTLDTRTNLYRVKATGAAWTITVPSSAPSTNHEGFRIDVTNTVATVATFDKTLHRTAFTNGVDSVTNSLSTANFSMWVRPALDGALVFNLLDATDDDFSRSSGSSSGGISGLTTGTLPYADSATTLADSPMTRDDAYTVRAANINATTNIRTASIAVTNTGTFGSLTVTTNLSLYDTGQDHKVAFKVNENQAADRTLNWVLGDSDRTITLSGNPTLGDWFDQSLKTSANPAFNSYTLSSTGSGRGYFLGAYGASGFGGGGGWIEIVTANAGKFYIGSAYDLNPTQLLTGHSITFLTSGNASGLAIGLDSSNNPKIEAVGNLTITPSGGDVNVVGRVNGSLGVASTATDTAVTIDSSGWTNTFGKNATVFLEFTNAVWTVYNNAGTAVFTNGLTVGPFILTVPLQVSGKIIVTSGAVAGTAVPF